MRKLLVASQKGGVGKTTTSINLAAAAAVGGARVLLLDADPLSGISTALNLTQHPNRRSLRAANLGVPGILIPALIPTLDVLSPYEDSSCSETDLDNLFRLLARLEVAAGYDCLVVDAPPFLGAKPAQLIKVVEEYLLVMRAEPHAERTLPAFQELVQRSRQGGKAIPMRGILLTLDAHDDPGCGQAEEELRCRFGTRLLSQVIPFDAAADRIRDAGMILVCEAPEAPAARAFYQIVESLGLVPARENRVVQAAASPIFAAAGTFQCDARPTPVDGRIVDDTRIPPSKQLPTLALAPKRPEHEEPVLPTDAGMLRSMPEIPVLRFPRPASRGRQPEPLVEESDGELDESRRPASSPTKPAASKRASAPRPVDSGTPLLVWVAVATVLGFALHFITVPRPMVPVVIGIAVTGGTLLVVRWLMAPEGPRTSTSKSGVRRRAKKSTRFPPETKKEPSARLASLAQRAKRSS